MAYSKEVVKRFEEVTNNPAAHGVGRFDPKDPNVATGLTGAPACGDVMKLDLKLDATALQLPPIKIHCSVLAEDSIKKAIEDWEEKKAGRNSTWMEKMGAKPRDGEVIAS